MAYPEVNEENVYLCTGNPLPSDIKDILTATLNESFADAHAGAWSLASSSFFCEKLTLLAVQRMKALKGLALSDILRELHLYVLRLKLLDEQRLPLIVRLAELENNLACGANERLQLTGLIAAFQAVRVVNI